MVAAQCSCLCLFAPSDTIEQNITERNVQQDENCAAAGSRILAEIWVSVLQSDVDMRAIPTCDTDGQQPRQQPVALPLALSCGHSILVAQLSEKRGRTIVQTWTQGGEREGGENSVGHGFCSSLPAWAAMVKSNQAAGPRTQMLLRGELQLHCWTAWSHTQPDGRKSHCFQP